MCYHQTLLVEQMDTREGRLYFRDHALDTGGRVGAVDSIKLEFLDQLVANIRERYRTFNLTLLKSCTVS